MLVFAWILWSVYILIFTIHIAMMVGCVIAINEGKEVKINFNPIEIITNIAIFVFLSIYIFG